MIYFRDAFMRGDDAGSRSQSFMLDAKDIQLLQGMFETQDKKFNRKIDGVRGEMQQGFCDVRTEMERGFGRVEREFVEVRTEMNRGFEGVEQEFVKVRTEMSRGFDKVRDDVIDVINQNLQPQLTSLHARATRLERRVA